MKLIFENSQGIERIIAFPENEKEAMKEIHKFVDQCNSKRTDGRPFTIHYVRSWKNGNRTTYDIGSHVEFFHLLDEVDGNG